MYNLIINPGAFEDVAEAYDYYLNIAGYEVAEAFIKELEKSYNNLRVNPFYQTRSEKYKGLPMKRFPFILFFEVFENENLIKVLALFNTYQNTTKWPK